MVQSVYRHSILPTIAIMLPIVAILLTACISVSSADSADSADSPPPLPNTLSGTVKFVNSSGQFDAPAGTIIEALIDNVIKGSITVTTAGSYSIDISGTYDDDNKAIIFRANNIAAEQTAVFNAGNPPPGTLDLIIDLPNTNISEISNNSSNSGGNSGNSGSSGGSSGGGGGAQVSAEDYMNIEMKERHDLDIFKDRITSYIFTNSSNPILSINITGNINAGETSAVIEVLRNTSSLLKEPVQGIVYKNINIWLGMSGFDVPKNIKEAAIRFRVDNSWIRSNDLKSSDIKMLRWNGSAWIPLETTEKAKDGAYTYYEAKTDAFSHFSIAGLKEAVPAETTALATATVPAVMVTQAALEKPNKEAGETAPKMMNGISLINVFVVIAIMGIYLKSRYRD